MRNVVLCLIFGISLPHLSTAADLESPHKIAGVWSGNLTINGTEMPLVFTFKELRNNQITGFLLSPSQTQLEIPIEHVSLKNRDLKVTIASVGGNYVGKLSPKTGKFRGKWTQGEFTFPLDLKFLKDGFEMKRPQTPKENPPYSINEVRFPNKPGGNVLDGTLTLPKKSMRLPPVVVLVSGSGPQDRDETLFGHKPFHVIADYLTRRGVAVLRYDDRGVGGSTGEYQYGTHMDFATDAAAAVAYLKTRKEIDPKKIGIIGHSEGGMLAPIVATEHPGNVAFIVMLAGPGVRGDLTILSQSKAIGLLSGLPESLVDLNQQFSRALFDLLLAKNPDPAKVEELGKKFEGEVKQLKNIDGEVLANLGETIKKQLEGFDKPWLPNFLKYDPGPTLEKVTCPVLALNGEKDLQVLSAVHLPEIKKRLKTNKNPHTRVQELKGLNHLFQDCVSGLPMEYGKIEETFSPAALKLINDWIHTAVN